MVIFRIMLKKEYLIIEYFLFIKESFIFDLLTTHLQLLSAYQCHWPQQGKWKRIKPTLKAKELSLFKKEMEMPLND
jgi:hypothetical protein